MGARIKGTKDRRHITATIGAAVIFAPGVWFLEQGTQMSNFPASDLTIVATYTFAALCMGVGSFWFCSQYNPPWLRWVTPAIIVAAIFGYVVHGFSARDGKLPTHTTIDAGDIERHTIDAGHTDAASRCDTSVIGQTSHYVPMLKLAAKLPRTNSGKNRKNAEVHGDSISAPNGIAIGGGSTVYNPSVTNNNFASPRRSLTDGQRELIKSYLASHCPFDVAVRGTPGNAESMQYADQLKRALEGAGCHPRRPKFMYDTAPAFGIMVAIHDLEDEKTKNSAGALQESLRQAGIKVGGTDSTEIEPGVVYMFVRLNEAEKSD